MTQMAKLLITYKDNYLNSNYYEYHFVIANNIVKANKLFITFFEYLIRGDIDFYII